MMVADTSVMVAGFASWHEHHRSARAAMTKIHTAIGHCLWETYSVLTRLPSPHRASSSIVADFLNAHFQHDPLILPAHAQRSWLARMPSLGVDGGSVYDAIVGCTALHHDAQLLTLDTRAEPTYLKTGVRYKYL